MSIYCSIPVGMYHHVNQNAGDFVTVSTANFESQMRWLAEEKYRTLSAAEFRECKLGLRPVPPRAVLLTFDDAWLDLYVNAIPILKHYGLRFTVFVVSDWTRSASESRPGALPRGFPRHSQAEQWLAGGRAGEVMCGWGHLEEMKASGLCSVENHTATHGTHRILQDENQLLDHIGRGQQALREHLGVESRQLCWPRGRYSETGLQVAATLNIDVTYLVRRGVNLPFGNAMKIKRFTVDDIDGIGLDSWLRLFSQPLRGYLYSRIKPDRWRARKTQAGERTQLRTKP
jgi:peptidoglycan/xylan/chitin deacetylase (PgdA/CDA1 family)